MTQEVIENPELTRSRDEKRHCRNNGNYSTNTTLFALYRRTNRKTPAKLSLLSTLRFPIRGQPKQLPTLREHPISASHAQYDLEGYHEVDTVIKSCGLSCPYRGNGHLCQNLTLAVEQAESLAMNSADLVTFECTGILFHGVPHTGEYKLTTRFYRESRQ